jgi:2-methylaconitate cis-trans-isomerase PrpF/2-methylcitrate dehydratase PrpD
MVRNDQTAIPAAYVRGGSSKALFFHEHDIPPAGPLRDKVLKRVMGTPDPIQIDGIGGTKAVTSKIAIIKPSDRPDADIEYTFAQVGVRDDVIAYDANCGNISSGVGPFAIDEGLIKSYREGRSFDPKAKTQEIRIYNTGTDKNLIAHVPVDDLGNSITAGDFEIAAVPGAGAAILMDYRETLGASQGKGMLPTGNAFDEIEVGGKRIKITICDVANICIFASAEDFGISGHETAANLTENAQLIAQVAELRGKAAQLVGMCKDWEKVDEQSPFIPMPVLIAPPPPQDKHGSHVSGRLFLDHMCHESMAGTGSCCFTACSRIKGSVAYDQVGAEDREETVFKIAHPLGMIPVAVETEEETKDTEQPRFNTLSFVRTSRRLMDGMVYVPKDLYDPSNAAHASQVNGTAKDPIRSNGVAVNGTNGHTPNAPAKREEAVAEEIPATEIFAKFISSVSADVLSPVLREKLKECLIDYIGVTAAAAHNCESTTSIYNAILALGGATGSCTVLTKGQNFTPQYAALLNATFCHSMDFDDTYAAGTLHAGVTAISAALTQAEILGSATDTDTFLAAIAVGYEIACRLGVELGFEAYSQGMHNTSTAGIFGAVAAIAVLKGLPAKTTAMAFGLAGSKASGSMQYLDNGSWNKRLNAGFAVQGAFECVALAEAGVVGATRAIEGKFGFLHAYSPNPNKDFRRLTAKLGTDWKFLGSSLKPFPACRMTHGFIEMAGDMGYGIASNRDRPIKSITLTLTPANHSIVGANVLNKIHPTNTVDAQFSAYFQTAHAWLYGSNTGAEAYTRLDDPKIRELCDKTTCVIDTSLTAMESTIEVEFEDGKIEEKRIRYPLGEVEHPFTRKQVDRKFFSLTTPVYGEKTATCVRDMVDGIEKHEVADLLELLK